MLALKISMILFLVVLSGVLVWILFGLLIGPLILKGIFDADLDDINEKRKCEECVKMDFNKWYDIYCLNTKKWSLGCIPSCRIDTTRPKFGDIIITSNYWNHSYCIKNVYVDFGFIGNLKYSRWRHKYLKNKKAQETQEREVKNLKFILESAQEDIEILKKQSEEEINKAAETCKKVKENLRKSSRKCYANDPPMITILDDDEVDF
uniref:TMEM9 n=1 Tax=Siphoviridae sp. ctLqe90 TaxID=2825456 RepID=A0A8S5Q219_9CAUD|nr:MAG TPA: TMEM9 [Siphoviridae sp. ctLqe90]